MKKRSKGPVQAHQKKDLGFCVASNKVMVEGLKVGFMYREEAEEDGDSGWRFLAGTEDEEYLDNPDNSGIYDVESVVLHDSAVKPYLRQPFGTELERVEGGDHFKPL
jgi:hypothetical protein